MNDKFDELAKGMAQSVTRRGALKKFGLGLVGIALAAVGIANRAHASKCLDQQCANECKKYCAIFSKRNSDDWNDCVSFCYGSNGCFRDCGV